MVHLAPPHLRTEDLSVAYGSGDGTTPTTVLHGINLTIRSGECVAIQGPSGSGKSTLFYVLGALLRPSAGRVFFNGRSLADLSDRELADFRNKNLGFVFQQFQLLPRTTVRENILLPTLYPTESSRTTLEDRRRAAELAERLGIAEHLDKMPNQLSGGQQQRVAIARALMRSPSLILADEPTGNLDSRSSEEVMTILHELHRQGSTLVLITHDPEIARRCPRILRVRDGQVVDDAVSPVPSADSSISLPNPKPQEPLRTRTLNDPAPRTRRSRLHDLLPYHGRVAWNNLVRNRARSLLTMMGVTIGIASVLAMSTTGKFTERRMLEGFEAIGVNRIGFSGYPTWNSTRRRRPSTRHYASSPSKNKPTKASGLDSLSKSRAAFFSFHPDTDLRPLRRIFPQILFVSPTLQLHEVSVHFQGLSVSDDVQVEGVDGPYRAIANLKIDQGTFLTPLHVAAASKVCVIGSDLPGLLALKQPLGETIYVSIAERSQWSCRIIGVLAPKGSSTLSSDRRLFVPYSLFQSVSSFWESRVFRFAAKVSSPTLIEPVAEAVKTFFQSKYGPSGEFEYGEDSVLLAQTKRFLTLFSLLLLTISLVTLTVGGIGIHNMMAAAVGDRLREIGLRKALGATSTSIRSLFLWESGTLCLAAGVLGIAVGFAVYSAMLWAGTYFVKNLRFEWILDPWAVGTALIAMVGVGFLSGLSPARRAETLEVIEAMRSDQT